MDKKVIILQGIPASGKSTWAREFIKDKTDWVIVNRDSIRKMRGDYWIPQQEAFISDCVQEIVSLALSYELNIIIDEMNLNPNRLDVWNELIDHENSIGISNYTVEYKMFKVSINEAIERDSKREIPISENVIRGIYDKYKNIYEL